MSNYEKELASVESKFVYTSDSTGDSWVIMKEDESGELEGDCEDFALTVVSRIAKGSRFWFWWYLITCQAVIFFCRTSWGEGHAQLWFRGKWVDNINPTWSSKHRHTLYFPYPWPLVAWKMLTASLPPLISNTLLIMFAAALYYGGSYLTSLL